MGAALADARAHGLRSAEGEPASDEAVLADDVEGTRASDDSAPPSDDSTPASEEAAATTAG